MENVVVAINLPATEESIEAVLPADRPIKDFLAELLEQIEQSRFNIMFDVENVIVCDLDRKEILDSRKTIRALGVRSGANLLIC